MTHTIKESLVSEREDVLKMSQDLGIPLEQILMMRGAHWGKELDREYRYLLSEAISSESQKAMYIVLVATQQSPVRPEVLEAYTKICDAKMNKRLAKAAFSGNMEAIHVMNKYSPGTLEVREVYRKLCDEDLRARLATVMSSESNEGLREIYEDSITTPVATEVQDALSKLYKK